MRVKLKMIKMLVSSRPKVSLEPFHLNSNFFWLHWTTIKHFGDNSHRNNSKSNFLLSANVLIRNFRKRVPTNDNFMRPIRKVYVRSFLTKQRGILVIFLLSFNCLIEGNKHLFAKISTIVCKEHFFLVFGKKFCVKKYFNWIFFLQKLYPNE